MVVSLKTSLLRLLLNLLVLRLSSTLTPFSNRVWLFGRPLLLVCLALLKKVVLWTHASFVEKSTVDLASMLWAVPVIATLHCSQ